MEIRFKKATQIKNYPPALIQEIEKQNKALNDRSYEFSLEKSVNRNLHWSRTIQGAHFWDDLYYGKDMSMYTQWLHLFEIENNYEIY